jgi:hypothetical protein
VLLYTAAGKRLAQLFRMQYRRIHKYTPFLILNPDLQTVPKSSIIESLQIGVIKMKSRSKSRRKTPWDKAASLTETQEFLKVQYTMKYDQRHPDADESEIQMINSYMPKYCPYCGSEKFIKKGWIQSAYKGTNASVEKSSNRQQGRYLSPEKYLLASGLNTVSISFAMSV